MDGWSLVIVTSVMSHDQVKGKEVGAHKSFLAAAHSAFDKMFFGLEAGAGLNRVKVSC